MNPRPTYVLSPLLPAFSHRRNFLIRLALVLAVSLSGLGMSTSVQAQRGDLQVEFFNNSPRAVKLMQYNRNGSGRWEDLGFVPSGKTVYQNASSGSYFAFVNPADNSVIKALTAERFQRQLAIDARDFGGGGAAGGGGGAQGGGGRPAAGHDDHGHAGGGGGGHGQVQPILVELHASNHSSETLFLYRDAGKGVLEYVATVPGGRDYKERTPMNTMWAFVHPNGSRVVQKLVVTGEHNDLEIHNQDLAPPTPKTVAVTFRKVSGVPLEIYHGAFGQRGSHSEGIVGHGQQLIVQVPPGDSYAVLRAADHSIVQSFQIPGRDTVFTVDRDLVQPARGGAARPSDGGAGGGHDDHDDRGHDDHDDDDHGRPVGVGDGSGGGGLPDPRDLLRRIFGGRG